MIGAGFHFTELGDVLVPVPLPSARANLIEEATNFPLTQCRSGAY